MTTTVKNGLATMRDGVVNAVSEEGAWLTKQTDSVNTTYTVGELTRFLHLNLFDAPAVVANDLII